MNTQINQTLKAVLYLIIYWMLFIIFPYVFAININQQSWLYNFAMIFIFFILFVSPFLFFLPYKLSNIRDRKNKIIYVLIGLAIPFIAIYVYFYISLTHMFDNFQMIG
jgi:membrane protease YdiL (CAAX protease family)